MLPGIIKTLVIAGWLLSFQTLVATNAVAQTGPQEEWGGLKVHRTGAALKDATHVAVFLHGFGGSNRDMVPLSEIIRVTKDTCLVFPEAPVDLDRGGSAWWTRPDQFQGSRDKVLALLKYVRQENAKAKIVLGGFSQGAILSSNFLEKDSELVTALILMSPVEKLRNNVTGKVKNKPAVFLSHGRSDRVLPFDGSQALNDRLVKLDYQVDWVPYDGGHNVAPVVIERLNKFVEKLLEK